MTTIKSGSTLFFAAVATALAGTAAAADLAPGASGAPAADATFSEAVTGGRRTSNSGIAWNRSTRNPLLVMPSPPRCAAD